MRIRFKDSITGYSMDDVDWVVDATRPYLVAVVAGDRVTLDTPPTGGGPFFPEVVAQNREVLSHLVSAAPRMYKLLVGLAVMIESGELAVDRSVANIINNTLAKAEGGMKE